MMVKKIVLVLSAVFALGFTTYVNNELIDNDTIEFDKNDLNDVRNSLSAEEVLHQNILLEHPNFPNFEIFQTALEGYNVLKNNGQVEKEILTIVDFSVSSNQKRLWVIDLIDQKVIYNTLVAHGRNSGEEFAEKFSNRAESFQSSLGFYATAEVYQGKHGFSLRLDGLEKGLNDKARARAVVIHGADYVAESFIKKNKRLGRSLGCPAIPREISKEVIEKIKDKSCLFIYHPKRYEARMNFLPIA